MCVEETRCVRLIHGTEMLVDIVDSRNAWL